MIHYSDPVRVEWLDDEQLFITLSPFVVLRDNIYLFIVAEGFKTDLASIPQWAQSIVPKLGHHLQPAVAHDYSYVHKVGMDKALCDKIFYDGMLSRGVRSTRAWLMYRAVRLGGKGRWV